MQKASSVVNAVRCSGCQEYLADVVEYGTTKIPEPVSLRFKCWKCGDYSTAIEFRRRYGLSPAAVRDDREADGLRNLTELFNQTKDGDLITLETRPCRN